MQFKHELVKKMKHLQLAQEKNIGVDIEKKNKQNNPMRRNVLYDLPNRIPQSSIVFNDKNFDNSFKQGFLLFEKYVKAGVAPLEINIEWRIRNTMTQYFDKIASEMDLNDSIKCSQKMDVESCTKLLGVFDQAIIEINEVLASCFTRYNNHILSQISLKT